jgi:hypothetical protein
MNRKPVIGPIVNVFLSYLNYKNSMVKRGIDSSHVMTYMEYVYYSEQVKLWNRLDGTRFLAAESAKTVVQMGSLA